MERDDPTVPAVHGRWIAALFGVVVALLVACVTLGVLLLRRGGPHLGDSGLLQDPELRRELVTHLAMEANALNDSHPDAEVGRVLVPSSEWDFGPVHVRTNRMGMRERAYVLPKPAELVRVVVLGDSFVFGIKCNESERLSARLEDYLRQGRVDPPAEVEVLSMGVSSWNLLSEIAYLRRQIDRLQPDLVIHITVPNDLSDVSGVRGFGALASFSPVFPERADSMIGIDFLPLGLGWESRKRFEEARARVLGLVADLARTPSKPRYLLVGHWGKFTAVLHQEIGRFLDPDSVLYSPLEFYEDSSNWIGPKNYHWNAAGNERLARVLFGLVRARGLLPALALAPDPEAERAAAAFAAIGLEEALAPCEEVEWTRRRIAPRLDLVADRPNSRQLHGGIDEDRLASPYVSILLGQPEPARVLHVLGRALPDSVLEDCEVHVWIEGHAAGTIRLHPDKPIDFRAELPAELRGREPLNVRLVSTDHVYRGDDLRHCVVFQLDSLALE